MFREAFLALVSVFCRVLVAEVKCGGDEGASQIMLFFDFGAHFRKLNWRR